MVPSFSTFNAAAGMFVTGFIVLAVWYSNTWNSGYLPINSNRIFDHFAKPYNVSAVLDERGMYHEERYLSYSAPYTTAAKALVYGFFFASYSAVVTHVALHHRYEFKMGLLSLFKELQFSKLLVKLRLRKPSPDDEPVTPSQGQSEYRDIHNRLMAAYREGSRNGGICAPSSSP
ncbi:hypothetical protein CDD81_7000 [Ophiocordyceps australis]|uniref:Uncharacterized protein n=1 Tax=Ophiocordyceps australis TaxID=1399860 RepID=A0A2C5YAJ7_9HYPO|nr:hypothetical protein CDD81_7000 [Ophiocordyceps australis]